MGGDVAPLTSDGKEIVMATQTYTVTGMTCSHCVNSVSAEAGAIPGVTDVQVDLASGTVTVTSDQPVDETAVAAAVDGAGYELAR
ncbi:copper ion binding protein [Actinoplanes teichomyceticus]|uniref:Copper ion binding protein n=2 Tax=Actinoplanes teichomyceticus TaxID=1867 RepID=A0A561WMI1_ACTTI|nr:copper ion binding protein [Actinoplanes teichomyceticus]